MNRTFQKGDVAKLNSGGPNMSVTEVTEDGQFVSCVWIAETGFNSSGTFPAVCLVYVEGTDPDKPPPNPPH